MNQEKGRMMTFEIGSKVFVRTRLKPNHALTIIGVNARTLNVELTKTEMTQSGTRELLLDKTIVISERKRDRIIRIEQANKERRKRWRKQSEFHR